MTAQPSDPFVRLELLAPPGWVRLPLDVDPDAWAAEETRSASAGLRPQGSSVGLETATELLASAARRAQHLWDGDFAAPVSLALQPDPLGRVYAVVDACLFPMEDLPLTPDRILGIGSDHGGILGDVETTEVELPAGRALRHRGLLAAMPGLDDPTSSQVTEALAYLITPVDLPGFVLLEAQWAELDLAEEIVAQVDEIADTLLVEARQ
ncbi:hypothetical protein K8Z61_10780 [Nocardioides sp. TRM66260-LWL]|uniref:hypothetical protein n=1 Tax=Nocardioides sp. TRM66260-LWL TaxID=2874478 RepID=UPI001CC75C47|nr:hypothetical protein [Nocardioides sp. TRM66260-LWL]MBZ5734982.1 hypothetical protein [Nocardioides sp. TRM66260-LWL]